MKRRQLISHLRNHGCFLVREGGKHSWWSSADKSRRSAVPRHTEIVDLLAKKICSDLGIPPVK
jgi:mRNA interferase HicA